MRERGKDAAQGVPMRSCVLILMVLAMPATTQGWEPIETAKLVPGQGAYGDEFGGAITFDGDTVIIGAPGADDNGLDSGSAFAFVRAGGVWTEEAELLAGDGASDARFGCSVSLDGDTAVIGANRSVVYVGSAYIFERTGGVWTEHSQLLASDGGFNDQFGQSVTLDGDTIVIGTTNDESAYVFVRSGGVWTEQAKLVAGDGGFGDKFGWSVSLDQDTVVIGAPGKADNGSDSGAAYVFVRTGGIWTEQAMLSASDGAENDTFGSSVSLDGDLVIVGAHGDDGSTGAAYAYFRSGGSWTEQAKLTARDGAPLDHFGRSVALDGATVSIGATGGDDNGDQSGSAYLFTGTGGSWKEQAKLLASDGADLEWFGSTVALDADTVIVGASLDWVQGVRHGSAYVYDDMNDGSIFADGFESGDTTRWSDSVPSS